MTATYSLNGASATPIPGGIFTKPNEFQIDVASTSIEDSGVYTITLTVSDLLLASFTQIFKVTVTNASPRITSSLPNPSIIHGKSISMPLAGYFFDDDRDTMTMTATYSLNGASHQPIPGGLFTTPSPFTIDATSAGHSDVGIYTISVIISDS
jgi:PKD repeat protein